MSDHPLDSAAIGQLYHAHSSWLRGWLSRRTGCREHAADLAQETFVRLLNARKQQTLQQPRAYLSSIARSLMIDQYRRRELERAYLESLERIDRLLDQLKPRVREAFLLAQLDGLTCAQIALRLGVSKATVERDLAKALHACYRLRYAEL